MATSSIENTGEPDQLKSAVTYNTPGSPFSSFPIMEPGSPLTVDEPLARASQQSSTEDDTSSTPPSTEEGGEEAGLDEAKVATQKSILATSNAARMSRLRRNVSWTDLATGDSLHTVVEYHPEKPASPPCWMATPEEPQNDGVHMGCQCTIM